MRLRWGSSGNVNANRLAVGAHSQIPSIHTDRFFEAEQVIHETTRRGRPNEVVASRGTLSPVLRNYVT